MSKTSDFFSGGGGSGFRLAPNLTWKSDVTSVQIGTEIVVGIDVSGGVLQTVLSLTGKFRINHLALSVITNGEAVKSKLTVDGVVIYDAAYTVSGTTTDVFMGTGSVTPTEYEDIVCEGSLLLEYATDTDSAINLNYKVSPIL